jgi:hypothetical protein
MSLKKSKHYLNKRADYRRVGRSGPGEGANVQGHTEDSEGHVGQSGEATWRTRQLDI